MKRRFIQPKSQKSSDGNRNSRSRETLPVRDPYKFYDDHHKKFMIFLNEHGRHVSRDPSIGLKEKSYGELSDRNYFGDFEKEKIEKSFLSLDKKHFDLTKLRWRRINHLLYFTFGCVFILFAKYIYE